MFRAETRGLLEFVLATQLDAPYPHAISALTSAIAMKLRAARSV